MHVQELQVTTFLALYLLLSVARTAFDNEFFKTSRDIILALQALSQCLPVFILPLYQIPKIYPPLSDGTAFSP